MLRVRVEMRASILYNVSARTFKMQKPVIVDIVRSAQGTRQVRGNASATIIDRL